MGEHRSPSAARTEPDMETDEAVVLNLPYGLIGRVKQLLPGCFGKIRVKFGNMGYTDAMLRLLPLVVVPFLLLGVAELGRCSWDNLAMAWEVCRNHRLELALWVGALGCAAFLINWRLSQRLYLVDFACHQPDDSLKVNYELSEYFTRSSGEFTLPSMFFQRKILVRSGLGEETYVPRFIFHDRLNGALQSDALEEAREGMFGSVDELLKKTGIDPCDIGIVVTNCSLFSPCPSMSDIIVNRYKLREDVKAYHLSGMGCSASVIACNLVKDMLKVYPDQYGLVISTENITLNWYFGNNKSMLVPNCLFRLGCAAMLLTNKRCERSRSRYEFLHCVRTHKAADDRAYGCAYQTEDDEGRSAVALNRDLMGVAADALRTNIITLGPRILPLSERLLFVFSLFSRHVLKMKIKQYQPDFKLAVQHFCLHAGGRAVIDEVQKNLFLSNELMEPSRATLHRFGNTSTSNLWYVLAYMEAKQKIKKGDKVWMLGLGSGFKCNSVVWQALADIPTPLFSPWLGSIQRYPAAMSSNHMQLQAGL